MPATRTPARRRTVAVSLLAAGLALLPACGDDEDDAGSDATTTTEEAGSSTTDGATDDTADAEEPAGDEPGVLEVELVDYAFEGLPESVPAGTRLTITNSSEAELHELIAIRIPDEETRPVEELVALPDEELGAIFGEGPPDTVLLAPPGGEQVDAVGDGTLTEPGRYVLACFMPTGVDPDAYLNAPPSEEGPPEVPGADGPPHIAHGMWAELVVE
jgi:hypothetical protein